MATVVVVRDKWPDGAGRRPGGRAGEERLVEEVMPKLGNRMAMAMDSSKGREGKRREGAGRVVEDEMRINLLVNIYSASFLTCWTQGNLRSMRER